MLPTFLLRLFVVAACVGLLAVTPRLLAALPQLTAEGEARRAAHDFMLGPFAKGKPVVINGEGEKRVVDEIVISDTRQELSGDVALELPPGTERVASMFRYIVLRGEGLDQLEGLQMHPYSKGNMSVSTQTSEIYRVKVDAMPVPSETMEPIVIRSKCIAGKTAVVTQIALNSQGKLSAKFDDIPFRNLGADTPRELVDVTIDGSKELAIGGDAELDRSRCFRYYAAPGNLRPSLERWAAERNFLPGRQIKKLQPALVVGYLKNQPKLTESDSRKGAADLRFFDAFDSAPGRTIPEFAGIDYAMCFNDYPEFMSVKQVGRGTPLVEHFADAAKLAAASIADELADGRRTAIWWEVKNESTIKAEWDYHYRQGVDSWGLMADLHNEVAEAVHQRAPGIQVGGPSSAWMQLQVNDFGLYRNQTRFMDETKGKLDFYSHHFYEDIGSLGAWERRENKYTNYLLGRLEAILDMFGAHMSATDNVRPILITECGSLQPGRGPSDYWLRLRSFSAYLHKLMRRPDQVELAVPFVFMAVPWNPGSGNAAFIPKPGMPNHSRLADCDPTPITHWFDLWRDFKGRRLWVDCDRDWLDVTALHDGDTVYVAATNMGGQRLSLNLAGLTKAGVRSVTQRRLRYFDGEVVYEDSITHANSGSIPLDVEETSLIMLKLAGRLNVKSTWHQERWYAPDTAVKVDGDTVEFEVSVPEAERVEAASLVVGVQRTGGLGDALRVSIGDETFERADTWLGEFNHLYAPVTIPISADTVQGSNRIRVDAPVGTTITSVQLVTWRSQ